MLYNWHSGHYSSALIHVNAENWCNTGMRRITTFQLTTDRVYDGGPIRLQYYNIIILTIMLQVPRLFSVVTYCTGLLSRSNRLYQIA
jgi:hypothetical protein